MTHSETETRPGRGRPRIYHDRSQLIDAARARKRRQRERERTTGLKTFELRLPADALTSLARTALFLYSDPKALASRLVAEAIPALARKVDLLERRAARLWRKAAPLLRHTPLLKVPGSSCRANARTYTHAQWRVVTAELAALAAELIRDGCPPGRVDRFCRRAAERRACKLTDGA